MEPNKPGVNNQPVMDVQKPGPAPAGGSGPQVFQPSAQSLNRPATMEYTRPRAGGITPDPDSTPDFSTTPTPMGAMKGAEQKQPKKSKKILASLLIIIGVVGIVGAGVYFYIAYKAETPEPATPTPVAATSEEQSIDATPEGVDATVEKVDKSLSALDDTADFPQTELSDDSLGL